MKQKILVLCLFILLLASYYFSCLPFFDSKRASYKTSSPADERALIWKIEGNGLTKPSFLMGTMHTQCAEIVNHIEGWEEASTQCEMVVSESTRLEVMLFMDSIGRITANVLNQVFCDSSFMQRCLINPEQWKEVYTDSQIGTIMAIDSTLLRTQPFLAIHTIKRTIDATAKKEQLYPRLHHINPKPVLSMDYGILYRLENERGLPNVALDDSVFNRINDNIGITDLLSLIEMEKLPFKEQADILYKYIEQRNAILDGMKAMDSVYYFHDPYRSDEVIKKVDSAFPDYDENHSNAKYSLMFAARNEKWMQKIPRYMEEKSCLIMVGVGHLVNTQSDRGLIHRLREMNYTVTPFIYKDGND